MTDQTPAPARPAVVTLEDVRQQLETLGLDARKTNASVIQKALGRGGMSTVQKHLDTIRAELDRPVVVADGEIPAGPKEALDALWRAAWAAAQLHTSAALATALLERDQARSQLETARADLEALDMELTTSQVLASSAAQQAQAAQAAQAGLQAALQAAQAQVEAQAQEAAQALAQAQAEAQAAMATVEAAHALEIAHFETRVATLQGQLDRMVEQLAEVKSLLPRQQQ